MYKRNTMLPNRQSCPCQVDPVHVAAMRHGKRSLDVFTAEWFRSPRKSTSPLGAFGSRYFAGFARRRAGLDTNHVLAVSFVDDPRDHSEALHSFLFSRDTRYYSCSPFWRNSCEPFLPLPTPSDPYRRPLDISIYPDSAASGGIAPRTLRIPLFQLPQHSTFSFRRVAQIGPASNARHALTDKGSTPSHHALVIPAPGQTFDSTTEPVYPITSPCQTATGV